MGGLLRELRRGGRFPVRRAAAAARAHPRAGRRSTRTSAGASPRRSPQFLDLVEFYVLRAPHADGAKPEDDLRAQGVAAVTRALTLPVYHVRGRPT